MRAPMSCRSISITSTCFSISAVGSRVSLYSENTGTLRRQSLPCGVSIMLSCTSERNPCCGPKMAPSVTSCDCINASTMWVKPASTDAGLLTMPTRRPFNRPDCSRREVPRVTGTRKLYRGKRGVSADQGLRLGIAVASQLERHTGARGFVWSSTEHDEGRRCWQLVANCVGDRALRMDSDRSRDRAVISSIGTAVDQYYWPAGSLKLEIFLDRDRRPPIAHRGRVADDP